MTAKLAVLVLSAMASCAHAFCPAPLAPTALGFAVRSGLACSQRGPRQGIAIATRRAASTPTMTAAAAAAPSWEQIKDLLGSQPASPAPVAPMLTLYRDNNGWCPFCERVWVALLVKGIPFDERTLSLQKKPAWYLEKVPTGLVPSIEFVESGEVVWESKDILMRLENDPRFSSYPSLLPVAELTRATMLLDECDLLTKSIAGILYGSNATSAELAAKMQGFEDAMTKMEKLLSESSSPFFLDSGFSMVDCMLVPILERLAVQLPLKTGIVLRDSQRWPHVEGWFVGMETQIAPYRDRVKGDVYSWSASFVTILEMFKSTEGVGGNDPILNARTQANSVLEKQLSTAPATFDASSRLEAVRKLVSNHAAIVADATSEAKTQKSLDRMTADDTSHVDLALRRTAAALLNSHTHDVSHLQGVSHAEAQALRIIASRLCVPRDMGAPAAAALRAGLGSVALAACK